MRAMVVEAYGEQPVLTELPKPTPAGDEVLVRVKAAGVCQTDLKIRDGHVPDVPLPLVLGHEIAGEVESVGPLVGSVAPGDRGVPYGYLTCGRCDYCVAGRTALCENVSTRYGFGHEGGYSEYVLVPERFFVPVPAGVPLDKAALASCSVVTPYHALVKRAQLRFGETVVVVGAGGGVGLHAVQIAHRIGAHVVGVDTDAARRHDILQQGADEVVVPDDSGFAGAVKDLNSGRGVDVVIDMVAVKATMSGALASLRSGGRLVLVGYHPGTDFSAATPDVVFREIEIYGSHWASLTDMREVIGLIARGSIEPIIMRHLPLEQAPEALDLLASNAGSGRTVLEV